MHKICKRSAEAEKIPKTVGQHMHASAKNQFTLMCRTFKALVHAESVYATETWAIHRKAFIIMTFYPAGSMQAIQACTPSVPSCCGINEIF